LGFVEDYNFPQISGRLQNLNWQCKAYCYIAQGIIGMLMLKGVQLILLQTKLGVRKQVREIGTKFKEQLFWVLQLHILGHCVVIGNESPNK
jgi:uncharacterized protein YhhL (DUF1145 family)